VGPRDDHVALARFLAAQEIHPVIDHVFPFEEAPVAFGTMESAGHLGKIVIELS
jgi:NADPH:quinone reductase-like Zn-dependent oxidoreductase